MNDSLIVEKLKELGIFALQKTEDLLRFVEKEAPDVLQQWINWNFWQSLILTVFAVIMLIILAAWHKHAWAKVKLPRHPTDNTTAEGYNNWLIQKRHSYWCDNEDYFVAELISFWAYTVVGGITALIILFSNLDWLKILVAEKVWL